MGVNRFRIRTLMILVVVVAAALALISRMLLAGHPDTHVYDSYFLSFGQS